MKQLQDTDPMPYGIHRTKPMADVPAAYLHFLWVNYLRENKSSDVGDYIQRNLDALRSEYNDGIWESR